MPYSCFREILQTAQIIQRKRLEMILHTTNLNVLILKESLKRSKS